MIAEALVAVRSEAITASADERRDLLTVVRNALECRSGDPPALALPLAAGLLTGGFREGLRRGLEQWGATIDLGDVRLLVSVASVDAPDVEPAPGLPSELDVLAKLIGESGGLTAMARSMAASWVQRAAAARFHPSARFACELASPLPEAPADVALALRYLAVSVTYASRPQA